MNQADVERVELGQPSAKWKKKLGGARPGSGPRPKREKIIEQVREELKDIATLEFWADMAKNVAVPRLRKILETSKDDRSAVTAAQEVLNRALGKVKEEIKHSGNVTIVEKKYSRKTADMS